MIHIVFDQTDAHVLQQSIDMDETLIANWNKKVKPTDTVWHMGDFAWRKNDQQYINKLNGEIKLIACGILFDLWF